MKKILFLFIIALHLFASVSEAEDLTCKIEPKVGAPGDRITIKAAQGSFGDKQGDSYVILSDKLTDRVEIESWENNKIEFIVPPRSKRKIVNVDLYINEEKQCAEDMKFGVYGIDLVEEAIKLRASKMQEPSIIDHLDYISRSVKGKSPDPGGYFGDYPLTESHIARLGKAGFQDDFIAKFEGHPQNVTLGFAALWLKRTADLAYAPIVRIFLMPRSYFHQYRPYFGSWSKSRFIGLLQLDRWDLNFGLTSKTPTTESDDLAEKKSYVLIGLSNQLNRSAMLNIGWALVPGDTEGVEDQFYAGFTVDSNFLREIGLIGK